MWECTATVSSRIFAQEFLSAIPLIIKGHVLKLCTMLSAIWLDEIGPLKHTGIFHLLCTYNQDPLIALAFIDR